TRRSEPGTPRKPPDLGTGRTRADGRDITSWEWNHRSPYRNSASDNRMKRALGFAQGAGKSSRGAGRERAEDCAKHIVDADSKCVNRDFDLAARGTEQRGDLDRPSDLCHNSSLTPRSGSKDPPADPGCHANTAR